jgi:N-methylhydantoinase B
MPLAVKAVIRAFPAFEARRCLHPQRSLLRREPSAGRQRGDAGVPRGTLLGFACVRAHWPDIGSNTPGSYGTATEIYGEGLRLPPVRLVKAGVPNTDVEAIIFTNVRTPEERRGDLRAQIAANLRGVTRLGELAKKYGAGRLLKIMQEVLDYSERMMRAMLSGLPDGTASFEELCDGDGVLEDGESTDRPFKIRMTVTKRGDTLTVDFAGTDKQVAGP